MMATVEEVGAGTAESSALTVRTRRPRHTAHRLARIVPLFLGALLFLFPFYYMLLGSLQTEPDTGPGGALPNPGNLTLHNYTEINGAINLVQSLVNSGIFTLGVVLSTLVFGLLAGYAMAVLHFRGRGVTFAMVLLVQTIPFQLLIIPLYVMLVRNYGLGDTYLGMILPFAIGPAAVFIFRQFFLQLPRDLFDAARIDGANEFTILRRIAVPLARPAILTVALLTFIGPWNEFLWPFLITKQADMQPLAVSLANYISNVASRAANPFGAMLAGACVLAAPVVGLFIVFQRHFQTTDLGSGVKG
jgi:multiple sugar transport system permease protein